MKINILLFFAMLSSACILAQESAIRVVFDVTSEQTAVHGTTIRHIDYMSEEYPDSEFEVVMYSGAYDMVDKRSSSVAADIEKLAKRKNVSFVVCKATIDRHNITASDLIPGVTTVPNGIVEIFTKQKSGWGYIKEGQ